MSNLYLTPYLRAKTLCIAREWKEGWLDENGNTVHVHPALKVILNHIGLWHYRITGRPAVVTCLGRTRAEQRALYPDNPDKISTHEKGSGADLRTRGLPGGKVTARAMEAKANEISYIGTPGKKTALLHETKTVDKKTGKIKKHAEHLHTQVGWKEPYPKGA